MANFCQNCGGKVNPDEKFCKNCGATLIRPVEVPKVELKPQPPPVFIPTPTKRSGPAWTYRVTDFLGVLIGIGIVILVLYSLGCAMGMFPNTQDQMCQSIHQAFTSGGGTTGGGGTSGGGTSGGGGSQVSIGCQHCSPGYCWTGTVCCPRSAPYDCNGYCYRSSSEAYSAGCHQSTWKYWCCQ